MMPEDSEIRTLRYDDLERATEVLAKAFQDDPLWLTLIPDEGKRAVLLPKFYRVFVKVWILNQQMTGTSDPLEAVAVWTAPGQKELDFAALLRAGFLRILFSPVLPAFLRAQNVFARFQTMQKQYAPDPHYYLNTVGVLPEAQGRGLASKLIKPVLAQANAQGVSIYTETMTPGNVSLYEHYGFRCMEAYAVPGTDLKIWAFYRAAAGQER